MNYIERLVVILYGIISLVAFIKGLKETKFNNNPYGLTPFGLLGIFVWGDAVIIGLFWMLACVFVLLVGKWSIGLLVISLFWVVRSFGEIIYWLLQQFAVKKRDEAQTVPGHSFFPGESVWFAQQVWWQMVLVVSLLATVLIVKSLNL